MPSKFWMEQPDPRQFPPPQKGDLRMWYVTPDTILMRRIFYWIVSEPVEAKLLLEFLDDLRETEGNSGDSRYEGGLEIYNGIAWEEWGSEEGEWFFELDPDYKKRLGIVDREEKK
jgi:hypothetical protein